MTNRLLPIDRHAPIQRSAVSEPNAASDQTAMIAVPDLNAMIAVPDLNGVPDPIATNGGIAADAPNETVLPKSKPHHHVIAAAVDAAALLAIVMLHELAIPIADRNHRVAPSNRWGGPTSVLSISAIWTNPMMNSRSIAATCQLPMPTKRDPDDADEGGAAAVVLDAKQLLAMLAASISIQSSRCPHSTMIRKWMRLNRRFVAAGADATDSVGRMSREPPNQGPSVVATTTQPLAMQASRAAAKCQPGSIP